MQARQAWKYVVALVAAAVVGAGLYLLLTRSNGANQAVTPTTLSPGVSTQGGRSGTTAPLLSGSFNYGFDLSNQAPDAPHTDVNADRAALNVLRQFAGSVMDISLYGFGLPNPEPSPGSYNLSSMQRRLGIIQEAGGIPAITLVAAPDWMRGTLPGAGSSGNAFFDPPSPAHYQDFAALCAHVASTFPQVRYFVVWNEMKRFFSRNNWDYVDYTAMYNDVYKAIKAVRPDAQVGGPYAVMSSYTTPPRRVVSSINGGSQWGYLDQGMLDTITYWLKQKVGADFLAVDGATTIAKADDASLTDPVTASMKYAAVDQWIRSQTDLPIWWMESHIQPSQGWTDEQAAAARVATLAIMSSSGAGVGMQWQPQEEPQWPDQGLWTSTTSPDGGQPTTLAKDLLVALPILRKRPTLQPGQPPGVLVGRSTAGTLLVNTLDVPASAQVGGATVNLGPGAVIVR